MYLDAEESFLRKFCDIKIYDWGTYYFWDIGSRWPKFNFIRINDTNKVNIGEVEKIYKKHKSNNVPTFIKTDIKFSVNTISSSERKLEFGGIPIAYLSTHSACFKNISKINDLIILKLEEKDELIDWWMVNSSGRDRENAKESPLFKVLLETFSSSEYYLILNQENEKIGCFAIDRLNSKNINLWGVAISKEFQGKKNLRNIYKFIFDQYGELIVHGQVNIDSITFYYRNKFMSTRIYSIEKKFEIL